MKQKKLIDVKHAYSTEVLEIQNKLNHLEDGMIQELTRAGMHGSLAHNIHDLRKMLNDLFNKIEYGKDSIDDEMAPLFESKESK
ncbi:hypothetical protein BCQ_PT04 (plasmid) [Bacillus cereus Q1]|uniref:Uncharacterized protein n=1 Tax=Bacillus cereus (strain Q1) TaxID=361100 RepID=B9J6H1_BACCQ|nr:hypothetical protein [Bacillus paranthracis]ACM15966.1 hypothetical protein BCQ_PT04 [Bacillus cereus Q1]